MGIRGKGKKEIVIDADLRDISHETRSARLD